jgi:transposase
MSKKKKSKISSQDKAERENKELKKRIEDLEKENQKLKRLLNIKTNSRNSSMSPSSDLTKPKNKKENGKNKRKRGGQPGRKGKARELFPKDEVDNFIPKIPETCFCCSKSLKDKVAVLGSSHQVVEIPEISAYVNQFDIYEKQCSCGAVTKGELPADVSVSCVGPRLQAVLSAMTGRYRLSRRETLEMSVAIFGPKAKISHGTLCALEKRTRDALDSCYEELKSHIKNQSVANLDETSWKEDKTKAWLWVAVFEMFSVFRIDRTRSREAFYSLLGRDFKGVIGTDRFTSYNDYNVFLRQLCWAHLKRNFQALVDSGDPEAKRIGKSGLRMCKKIAIEWGRYQNREIKLTTLKTMLSKPIQKFKRMLERGQRADFDKAGALCRELLKYYPALWTFTRKEGVDTTNNIAERNLRKGVLWRKGSFGSDSESGSRFVERMLTVAETLKTQKRNVIDFIHQSIVTFKNRKLQPSLIP